MHWAIHGHTAAEIILERADSNKDFMGLTTFNGNYPTLLDATIAKNYLTDKELDILNRISLKPTEVEIHYLESIKDLEMIDTKN